MIGVFTIAFNQPDLIARQIQSFRRHVSGAYHFRVMDNSSEDKAAEDIRRITEAAGDGFYYARLPYGTGHLAGHSHQKALNFTYHHHKSMYDVMLFLDHDVFPVTRIDLEEEMRGFAIWGYKQQRLKRGVEYLYMWPGLVMLDNRKIDMNLVDFDGHWGITDSGGKLAHLIAMLPAEQVKFIGGGETFLKEHPEIRIDYFEKKWVHFSNGSNWQNLRGHDRILALQAAILEDPERYILLG